MATMSPWGKIDTVQKTSMRGVSFVSTPSHGGLRISKGIANKYLNDKILSYGIDYANYYFFEEDCSWAIPIYHSHDIAIAVQGLFVKPVSEIAKGIMETYFKEML